MPIDATESLREYRGKKVYVGLSGGVDSAVAAHLLRAAGADVTGIFMKNWAGEQGLQLDCPWQEDQESAQAVAAHLGIGFASYNFEREYKERVLDNFFAEYKAGRTPNPDILCNSEVKFKAFLHKAELEGADFIATGHYAGKLSRSLPLAGSSSRLRLLAGTDEAKNQVYFLARLTEQQLQKAVFPLAGWTKSEVRAEAKRVGLPNADRPDSQGICFIGDLDVQKFLRKYLAPAPGEIRDLDTGEVLGSHDGVHFFTVGQREGLRIGGSAKPYYVAEKDPESQVIWAVQGRDNPSLYSQTVTVSDLHWLNADTADLELGALNSLGLQGVTRYRSRPVSGEFTEIAKKTAIFKFSDRVRAVTPGQTLAIFTGNICLGSAVIES